MLAEKREKISKELKNKQTGHQPVSAKLKNNLGKGMNKSPSHQERIYTTDTQEKCRDTNSFGGQ